MTTTPFLDWNGNVFGITRESLHVNLDGTSSDVRVSIIPPDLQAARYGQIGGKTAYLLNVLGSRSRGWSSTNVLGDACEYLNTSQALMNTPTAGQTLYLVSTSTSDTAAGVGAQVIHIEYLDATGVQRHAEYDMNGTTPVNIGAGYSFIQLMEVDRLGSSEVSAGDITISSTNGVATVATTFEMIAAGGNRSLSGRIKVPLGYSAFILNRNVSAISATMDVRLRATVHAYERTLSTVYHFEDRVFLASGQNNDKEMHYIKCPALSVIKFSAFPGGAPAGNKLDCTFTLLFIAD